MRMILSLFCVYVSLFGRVVVDDFNRSVEVPDVVRSIYTTHPPLTLSVLAFDPALVAALNMPFKPDQKAWVGPAFDKSVAGGYFGQGQSANLELLAQIKPDVILMWGGKVGSDKLLAKIGALGIPVLLVNNRDLSDLITQFRLLGTLTRNTARAMELIDYTKESLRLLETYAQRISKYPEVRYYFAQGSDGLSTECDGSFHIQPFVFAGAKNAMRCTMSSGFGMEKVSLESVLAADPDVIVAMEREFALHVKDDPRWKSLRAVREGRVMSVPSRPFNYISRPPSFMRLVGIRWLMGQFYPGLLQEDEQARFEAFFFPYHKEPHDAH
ncbi:MAG: ABC transporter substrate-binding protein [Campylobacterales bacterium]|nr:ABC transporter substrate-binding protein [Campylobacterales bacterium]